MAFTSTSNRDEACLFGMQLACAPALSMALRAAIELDLLEIIAQAGPGARLSLSDIASHLPTNNPEAPAMLDRIMCLLACYSIVTSSPSAAGEGDGNTERRYGLAPVSEFLVRNREGISLAPVFLFAHDKVLMESMYHIKDAVLEGGIPLNKAHGMGIFAYAATDDNFNKILNKAMENLSVLFMMKILETYKGFEGLEELVDVGGGVGTTLSMIISKHQHIKGINFDLPHVVADAPTYPGVEHVGGDMFVSVPNGEAIFMKWVLHDWSDEQCLKLLKNCYKALPNTGKVIVVESILSSNDHDLSTKCAFQLDMLMLAFCDGGKERSEQQFEALARVAGFAGIKVVCSAYGSCVMEFYKKD